MGGIVDGFISGHVPQGGHGRIALNGAVRPDLFFMRHDPSMAKPRLFQIMKVRRQLKTCTGFARAQEYRGMMLSMHESREVECALYLRNGCRVHGERPAVPFRQESHRDGHDTKSLSALVFRVTPTL